MEELLTCLILLSVFIVTTQFVVLRKLGKVQKIIQKANPVTDNDQPPRAIPVLPPDEPLSTDYTKEMVCAAQSVPSDKQQPCSSSEPELTFWKKVWNWIIFGEEYRSSDFIGEYSVATTWLIRAGIIVLLVGFGFLLKYSLEVELFSPLGKVVSLASCGTIAVIVGMCLCSGKYRVFFLGVSGGGAGLLYFSIFAGHKLYSLYSLVPALVFFSIATVLILLSAWHTNGMITAVIGAAGAFAAPVMFNHQYENTLWAFLWLTVTQCVFVLTALRKKWDFLRLLVAAGYFFIAFDWIGEDRNYFLFLLMAATNFAAASLPNFCQRDKFTRIDGVFAIIHCGTFLFLALPPALELYRCYHVPELISGILMLVCLLFCRLSLTEPARILFPVLTAAMAVITVSLAVSGMWLVALLSLLGLSIVICGQKFNQKSLCAAGIILFMYIPLVFTDMTDMVFIKRIVKEFFSYGLYGISLLLAAFFISSNKKSLIMAVSGRLMYVFGGIYLFVFLTIETYDILKYFLPEFKSGGVSVLWGIIGASVLLAGIKKQIPVLRKTGICLFALTCVKVLFVDVSATTVLWRIAAFAAVGILLLLGALLYIRRQDLFKIR